MPLILTDALDDSAHGRTLFDTYVTPLTQATGRPLHRIILDIEEAENIRRLLSPDRTLKTKLRDPDILCKGRATLRILDAGTPLVTHIDVTHLSPDAAAATILSNLQV